MNRFTVTEEEARQSSLSLRQLADTYKQKGCEVFYQSKPTSIVVTPPAKVVDEATSRLERLKARFANKKLVTG